MPKTLTSALQEGFFSQHDEIHFLGVGVGSLIDYVNDEINRIFETLIPYSSESYYLKNKKISKDVINLEHAHAREQGKLWIGVSSEWLGFNFSPEMVDPELKTKRLSELMGSDAHIILIIRNNIGFLKSLYAELVKVGLPLSFQEYCEYLWLFQDRSSLSELLYDEQYERLARYFQRDRIHILVLESHRNADGSLIENNNEISLISELCALLGIKYPENFSLPQVNPSLNKYELKKKLELNKEVRHDFGNLIFEPSNIHRSRKQIQSVSDNLSLDIFKNVKIKRDLLEKAKLAAASSKDSIDFYLSDEIKCALQSKFKKSNFRFEKLSGVKLPEEYYSAF